MRMSREKRLAWWVLAVLAAAATPLVVHSGIAHGLLIGSIWLTAWLSALLALLASTPRNAIKLPSIASELIVLGGMVALHWGTLGHPGWTPVPALLILLVNHTALSANKTAPPSGWSRAHLVPAFNLWPLAPMLWHPALWLTSKGSGFASAFTTMLTKAGWAGVGLWVAAGLGSSFSQRPGLALPCLGWVVWIVAAVLAASFF